MPTASQVTELTEFNSQLADSLQGIARKEKTLQVFDSFALSDTPEYYRERIALESQLGDLLIDVRNSPEVDNENENVSFRRPDVKDQGSVDMTPMVDVSFLLLKFFLVTASFIVQKSIQRPAEQSQDPSTVAITVEQDDHDAIVVQVDESNAYNVVVNGVDTPAVSKQDLIVLLTNAFSAGGPGERPSKLVVDAHENCIHAAVVGALDAGREANFGSFEVRTVEQFE